MPKNRKAKKRDVLPVFHIVCEGKKTEPNYIDHYIKAHCQNFRNFQVRRIKLDDVFSIKQPGYTDPKSLVREAIEEQEQCPEGDIFWCVYDREGEHAIPGQDHQEASEKAKRHGIEIAFSNVCFEVWLLLHRQAACAAYCSYDDLKSRSKLRSYYENYEKGDKRSFPDEEIAAARKNAPRMNERTRRGEKSGSPVWSLNPYTDFYRLLDAIDRFFELYCQRCPAR